MNTNDTDIGLRLEQLLARPDEQGDWERVLRDAKRESQRWTLLNRRPDETLHRLSPRKRVAIVFAVAIVVALIPVLALASAENWWFFSDSGAAPIVPNTSVVVVKSGSWNGVPWQIVAYRSLTDGLCFGLTPNPSANATGIGAGMGCASVVGVPTTSSTKPGVPFAITYLAGSGGNDLSYIVGPVIPTAAQVEVTFTDGSTIQTPTFAAPSSLGDLRFYAAQLPHQETADDITRLVGVDANGREVAHLNPAKPNAP